MIRSWIIKYREFSEDALINKKNLGEESIKFNNLINGNWKTNRPFEKVVFDTTKIWLKSLWLDILFRYNVRESMFGNKNTNIEKL